MAYIQVKEILARAQRLRRFVSDFAKRHEANSGNSVLAGFYAEVVSHQARQKQVLKQYRQDAEQGVRETWIQFSGVEDLDGAINSLADVDDQGEAEVFEAILNAERALKSMFDQSQRQVSAPRLQELFSDLADLQDHHVREIANCVSEWQQSYQE